MENLIGIILTVLWSNSCQIRGLVFCDEHIYKKFFNTVILLKKNFRAKDDEEFADILARCRIGEPTDKDIEMLNTRVCKRSEQLLNDDLTTIVPDNKKRLKINRYAFAKRTRLKIDRKSTEWKQGMQLVIESDMRRLKSGATLDESWRRRIAESLSLDPKRNKKFGLLLEIDFSQKYLVSGKNNPENKFNLVCGSFLCAYYVLIILLF